MQDSSTNNDDNVILITFANKEVEAQPTYGSSLTTTNRQVYQLTTTGEISSREEKINSMFSSLNRVLACAFIVYILTLLFPKTLRKPFMRRGKSTYSTISDTTTDTTKTKATKRKYGNKNKGAISNSDKCLMDEESLLLSKDEGSNKESMHRASRRTLFMSRRRNYGSSLPVLETKFINTCSIEKAKQSHNDELSPLEYIQDGGEIFSVFRETKPSRKKVNDEKKEHNDKTPNTSNKNSTLVLPTTHHDVHVDTATNHTSNTPLSGTQTDVQTDVFSVDTHLFSPPANIMDAFKPKVSRNSNSNSNSILVERQMNHVNVNNMSQADGDCLSDFTKTPQSLQTNGDRSTNMEFTPSPLSIFSKNQVKSQAIVILISSDIMYHEQHVQQQHALKILLSNNFTLPVKVIDGSRAKDKKRREELFRISGIRGQFPQIFSVDSTRKMKYVGNHISLNKLSSNSFHGENENLNGQEKNSPSLLKVNIDNAIDASFFSI